MLFLVPSVGLEIFFGTANFVPFLHRQPGKVAFLALRALREFNDLRRINQVNSSTPSASTTTVNPGEFLAQEPATSFTIRQNPRCLIRFAQLA